MSAWWAGLPSASARVRCRGEWHRVLWREGSLHALDHDDVEGERTLGALGGEPCECVRLLDAWAAHATDERMLVLATRGPADPLAPQAWGEQPDEDDESGWFAYSPMGAGGAAIMSVTADDFSLARLPGGLAERLVATVAAGLREPVSPRAFAALHGRVRLALAGWLGRPELELDLTLAPEPALSLDGERAAAALPFAWLVDVWAPGLTTLLGRFTLAARLEDGAHVLTTVTPELAVQEVRIAMSSGPAGSQTGT